MLRRIFAALAFACALSSHASADNYTQAPLGMDRTVPTATPVCIMSGPTCKVQIGTANLSSGEWVVSGISPTLGITRSQIATTTIPSAINTFVVAGYASVFDGGEGCEWSRATVSAPGAVQSADGAYWALSRTSAIDIKCVGGLGTSSDIYSALVSAANIAKSENPSINSFGQILLSNKHPYLTLATAGATLANGEGINGCAAGNTVILATMASGVALTTTGGGVNIDCINISGSIGNTATGLQLGVGASDEAGQQRVVRDTNVRGMYNGIDSVSGAVWQLSNVYVDGWSGFGLRIDNPTCDSGDWFMNGVTIGGPAAGAPAGTKGVHWKCSGGGKITGTKIFYGDYGWYSEPRAGTVDMQFAACSIEGQSVAGMYFVSGGAGGTLGSVTISSCEFGGLPEGVVLVSGVAAVTIVGNSCANIGIACIRIEDGVGRVWVGHNDYDPAAIPVIDNRVDNQSMWGYIDRDQDRPVAFSSDATWTILARYVIPANGYSMKFNLFIQGQLFGNGYITRDITGTFRRSGVGTVVATFDRDIINTTGGIFDFNIDTTSEANTAIIEVKRSPGVGTNFIGTMTQHIDGPLQSYKFF